MMNGEDNDDRALLLFGDTTVAGAEEWKAAATEQLLRRR